MKNELVFLVCPLSLFKAPYNSADVVQLSVPASIAKRVVIVLSYCSLPNYLLFKVIIVLAPITHDGAGNLLNTNADTIAATLGLYSFFLFLRNP